jgi:hypothetical protein
MPTETPAIWSFGPFPRPRDSTLAMRTRHYPDGRGIITRRSRPWGNDSGRVGAQPHGPRRLSRAIQPMQTARLSDKRATSCSRRPRASCRSRILRSRIANPTIWAITIAARISASGPPMRSARDGSMFRFKVVLSSSAARGSSMDLRAIEDRFDGEAADAALKDVEANGTVSWEEMKAKLGL